MGNAPQNYLTIFWPLTAASLVLEVAFREVNRSDWQGSIDARISSHISWWFKVGTPAKTVSLTNYYRFQGRLVHGRLMFCSFLGCIMDVLPLWGPFSNPEYIDTRKNNTYVPSSPLFANRNGLSWLLMILWGRRTNPHLVKLLICRPLPDWDVPRQAKWKDGTMGSKRDWFLNDLQVYMLLYCWFMVFVTCIVSFSFLVS